MANLKLYGSPISYYTGKMEAYLRYQEIPYDFVVATPQRISNGSKHNTQSPRCCRMIRCRAGYDLGELRAARYCTPSITGSNRCRPSCQADLVTDPIATIEAIRRACAVDWTTETRGIADARLAKLRQQHGAHKYAPQDFGLDPDEILSQFARYRSRFGLR